ncbi:MAG: hypothetical protein U0703_00045 [Anaerolineae bacterium]
MRLRHHVLVFLFYLGVTVVITFPLITVIGTRLIGHPISDAYEYTHHVWWIKTALQTGQNPYFMPNLVYPDGASAGLLWGIPFRTFPAWLFAFVLPLPAAFNVSALLTLALNGWAMFVLARYLHHLTPHPPLPRVERGSRAPRDGGEVAALLAGLVFMLYPAFQGQLGAAHVDLLTLFPAPLYLYALLRLRDTPHPRRVILAGAILFVLSFLGNFLLLLYLIAPITALYGVRLLVSRDWLVLRRALATVVLGALLSLPFVVPLLLDSASLPAEEGAVRYSADLLGVVSPSFYHPLFNSWDYNRRVLGLEPFETTAYVGVIAAALAGIAVWKVRAARGWLALALVAWVFSLGPLLRVDGEPLTLRTDGYASYVTLPWALFQNLPLISIARTPARFNFAVGFAVAVMVGYGAAYLWRGLGARRVRWIALVGVMGLIAFEYQVWWGLPTVPGVVPEPIAALAARGDVRAVLDIPGANPLVDKEGMFLQTAHGLPLITGQVARRSPVNPAKVALLEGTLDPALLDAAGVDIVILHREHDDGSGEAFARQQLGDPIYADDQYAVFETPLTDAAPGFAALPTSLDAIEQGADSYAYAPDDGWVMVEADLSADEARQVDLLLNGVVVGRWSVSGSMTIRAPLPVAAGSFNTITLALDPSCPAHVDPTLACRSVSLDDLKLDFTPTPLSEQTAFERGVTLTRAYVPSEARAGETLSVWLWWGFTRSLGMDDIRFVHVTDAAGTVVAQQDNPLGEIAPGETRAESVDIALPADLPPGEYTVSAGWYTYPDIANFCVLVNDACGDPFMTLGTVNVTS